MNAKKKVEKGFGAQAVAEMMNHLDTQTRDRLLKVLQDQDPDAFAEVRDRMLTFEDLAQLRDDQIRNLLQKIPQAKLALALRKSSEALKAVFYRNMAKVAAETLKISIDEIGPQKLSLVEWAQREIIDEARKLK